MTSAPRSRAAAATSAFTGWAAASSGTFTTTSSGRRERKPKWAISFSSASLQRIIRSALPLSSSAKSRSSSWYSAPVFPCSLRSRSRRFSTTPRSFSTSSASKSRNSRAASGGVPSGATKPRTTRQKASTSERELSDSFGSPAPFACGPATSTKSISANVVLRGLKIAESASTRGSGTLIAPRLTWPRPPGTDPLCSPVSALKSMVFPDCAYPTRPAFMKTLRVPARGACRDGTMPRAADAPRVPIPARSAIGPAMPRKTPLHEAHLAAGARMVEFAGFDMPVQYKGVLEEHAAVREHSGIFDVSHMGEVVLEGAGALESAQRLVTNDLTKCKDGQAQYSALCNEKGGVIDDIIIYRYSPERLFVCVNASGREKDFEWMRERKGDGTTLHQRSDDWAQVAIQGPDAPPIVDSLCQPKVIDLAYYHFREATVAGVRGCIVARTGYTGEDGFEVFAPPHGARKLWDALLEKRVVPCGLGARDSLRLEVAYRLYGNDMDEQHTPLEAGLGWIVKLDKPGGFVGSDALIRQKQEGLKRRLAGFKLTGKGIARQGYPVLQNGQRAGEVTSGTMSPILKEPIGLAYLPTALAKEGSAFEVEIRGKPVAARVVKTPFVEKIKS